MSLQKLHESLPRLLLKQNASPRKRPPRLRGSLPKKRLKPRALKPSVSKQNALEWERLEAERLEAERMEAERIAAGRAEAQRAAAEQAAVQAEEKRVKKERREAERLAAEQAAAEAEAARLEAEQRAAERLASEQAAAAERAEAQTVIEESWDGPEPSVAASFADIAEFAATSAPVETDTVEVVEELLPELPPEPELDSGVDTAALLRELASLGGFGDDEDSNNPPAPTPTMRPIKGSTANESSKKKEGPLRPLARKEGSIRPPPHAARSSSVRPVGRLLRVSTRS